MIAVTVAENPKDGLWEHAGMLLHGMHLKRPMDTIPETVNVTVVHVRHLRPVNGQIVIKELQH